MAQFQACDGIIYHDTDGLPKGGPSIRNFCPDLWGHGDTWVEAFCAEQAAILLGTDACERQDRGRASYLRGTVTFLDGGVIHNDGVSKPREVVRSRSTDMLRSYLSNYCRPCDGTGQAFGEMQFYEDYAAPFRHPCKACGATGRC